MDDGKALLGAFWFEWVDSGEGKLRGWEMGVVLGEGRGGAEAGGVQT